MILMITLATNRNIDPPSVFMYPFNIIMKPVNTELTNQRITNRKTEAQQEPIKPKEVPNRGPRSVDLDWRPLMQEQHEFVL